MVTRRPSSFGHIYHFYHFSITGAKPDGQGAAGLRVIEVIDFSGKKTGARAYASLACGVKGQSSMLASLTFVATRQIKHACLRSLLRKFNVPASPLYAKSLP